MKKLLFFTIVLSLPLSFSATAQDYVDIGENWWPGINKPLCT